MTQFIHGGPISMTAIVVSVGVVLDRFVERWVVVAVLMLVVVVVMLVGGWFHY